jgi:hypothetical protein
MFGRVAALREEERAVEYFDKDASCIDDAAVIDRRDMDCRDAFALCARPSTGHAGRDHDDASSPKTFRAATACS